LYNDNSNNNLTSVHHFPIGSHLCYYYMCHFYLYQFYLKFFSSSLCLLSQGDLQFNILIHCKNYYILGRGHFITNIYLLHLYNHDAVIILYLHLFI